jgi:ceramide glucosyltransferase
MFSKLLLLVWSGLGVIWAVISWRLVADEMKQSADSGGAFSGCTLSIFKPLPPLGSRGLEAKEKGLESFIAQLDEGTEMLLGIHEADRAVTASFLERVQGEFPGARLKVIFRSVPDAFPNPKIAWQKVLAVQAEGDLWLWSDSDIVAPPGFLRAARKEWEKSGVAMVTYPYVVRDIPTPPAWLDALFVNVDFYPGLLLLRKFGPVDFGLGAAMLFRRDDFLRLVDWEEIGSMLADDFFLGQKLRPVLLGSVTLQTAAEATGWIDALQHDFRWTKTIRWNRPLGSAARIFILPILGWLGYAACSPLHLSSWLGLLAMMQIEVFFAVAVCRQLDCPLRVRDLLGLELWTLWRVFVWLGAWAPVSTRWSGKKWRAPRWT